MTKKELRLNLIIKELKSELSVQKEIIRSYDEREMKMLAIQRDYERRLDFFHAAVNAMTGSFIGTWDLSYAIEQGIKMKVLGEYNAGEDLAELYSEYNAADLKEVQINNLVVDMVYDRAANILYEMFPNAHALISYTGHESCWTTFFRCDDDDGELYKEFCKDVKKKRAKDPWDFQRVEAILKVVFEDINDKKMADFLNESIEIVKQMS